MFQLIKNHPAHKMMAVERHDLTPEQVRLVRRFISANHRDDPAYQAKEGVSPFLQGCTDAFSGQCEPGPSNWVFIEFWSAQEDRIQNWIKMLNEFIVQG